MDGETILTDAWEQMMDGETIECAAIMFRGVTWSMPRPARHHDVIAKIVKELPLPESEWPVNGPQGFVTSKGRFVERTEAAQIAHTAGQIPELHVSGQLYSEDLW